MPTLIGLLIGAGFGLALSLISHFDGICEGGSCAGMRLFQCKITREGMVTFGVIGALIGSVVYIQ